MPWAETRQEAQLSGVQQLRGTIGFALALSFLIHVLDWLEAEVPVRNGIRGGRRRNKFGA